MQKYKATGHQTLFVEGGWVKMMGAGPTTKYSLTGKELPDFTR